MGLCPFHRNDNVHHKAHDTHAIVFAPELKSAFLSAERSVDVLDTEKMKVVRRIDLSGKDPDAILYDAFTKRVFTFNGGGTKDATAIDTSTGKVVGSVPLGGKPEFAQTDGDGHIYVNIEDKNQVVSFDSKTLKVLRTWPIAPCKEPSGLAIDVEHKRLFAGCHNQLMAVVDYTNGKVVATVPIGRGVQQLSIQRVPENPIAAPRAQSGENPNSGCNNSLDFFRRNKLGKGNSMVVKRCAGQDIAQKLELALFRRPSSR